jgi:protoporphyrinogen oxidase
MIASGAPPTTLKLKLAARYLPYLSSHARTLDANDPAATGGVVLDTESIGAWGRREVGDEFVELLAYPLLAAYYGALPEETSAPVYHALARVGMDVSVRAAVGGFATLADAWLAAAEARGARFIAGADVARVVPVSNGVGIDASAGGGMYDAVVIAVPANRAAAMLSAEGDAAGAGAAREWLAGVRVRSSFTVAFRVDRPFPGDYFGLSFPRTSDIGRTIAAVCIQGRKLPGLVPSGDALVVLPAPTAVPSLYEADDERVAGAVLRVLEGAVKGIGNRVTKVHVQRFQDAYSIYEPGHLRRIAHFGTIPLPARVALAGDYLTSASVEGAVRSGLAAADRVLSGAGG